MPDRPSPKKALLDLYRWATQGPRSGNPYQYEPVKNARRALGDPRGYDLPAKKPTTAIGKALYDLSEWSTGPNRAGNPYGVPAVRAANRALGGDGYNLPGEGPAAAYAATKSGSRPVTPTEAADIVLMVAENAADARRRLTRLGVSSAQARDISNRASELDAWRNRVSARPNLVGYISRRLRTE